MEVIDAPPDTDDEWSSSDDEAASKKPRVESHPIDDWMRATVREAVGNWKAKADIAARPPVSGLPSPHTVACKMLDTGSEACLLDILYPLPQKDRDTYRAAVMDAHAKEQGARSLQETKRAAAAKEHFEDKELFVTVQFNGDGLPRHGFDVPDTRNLLDLAPVVTELLKRPTEDHPFVEFYIEGAPSELNGLKSLRRIMEDLQHSPELPLKLDVTIRELPAVLLRARNAIKTEKELERELHHAILRSGLTKLPVDLEVKKVDRLEKLDKNDPVFRDIAEVVAEEARAWQGRENSPERLSGQQELVRRFEEFGYVNEAACAFEHRVVTAAEQASVAHGITDEEMRSYVMPAIRKGAQYAALAEATRMLEQAPLLDRCGHAAAPLLSGTGTEVSETFQKVCVDMDTKLQAAWKLEDEYGKIEGSRDFAVVQALQKHPLYEDAALLVFDAAENCDQLPLKPTVHVSPEEKERNQTLNALMGWMRKPFGLQRRRVRLAERHSELVHGLSGYQTRDEFKEDIEKQVDTYKFEAARETIEAIRDAVWKRFTHDQEKAMKHRQQRMEQAVQSSIYCSDMKEKWDFVCGLTAAVETPAMQQICQQILDDHAARSLNGRFPNGQGCEGCGQIYACEAGRRDNKCRYSVEWVGKWGEWFRQSLAQLSTQEDALEWVAKIRQYGSYNREVSVPAFVRNPIEYFKQHNVEGNTVRAFKRWYMTEGKGGYEHKYSVEFEFFTEKERREARNRGGAKHVVDVTDENPWNLSVNISDPPTSEERTARQNQMIEALVSTKTHIMDRGPLKACTGSGCRCRGHITKLTSTTIERYERQYFFARLMQGLDNEARAPHMTPKGSGFEFNEESIGPLADRLVMMPRSLEEFRARESKARLCDGCFNLYAPVGENRKLRLPLQPCRYTQEPWSESGGSASTGRVLVQGSDPVSMKRYAQNYRELIHVQTEQQIETAAASEKTLLMGEYCGARCDTCNYKFSKSPDEKRLGRDLFLFKTMTDGQDCTGVFQASRGRLFVDGGRLVLHGYSTRHKDVKESVINKILAKLQDGRALPASWGEYKSVMRSAGALCPQCWANVCSSKEYSASQ